MKTMDVFLKTFEAVAVLLGIGLLGFVIIARKILPEEIMGVLPPLVIDIALPCLVFRNILLKFDPATHSGWWKMPLWWGAFMLLTGLLTFMASKTVRRAHRSEFALSLYFQNAMFVPLAVLAGMFGSGTGHIVNLFLFTLFYPALLFNAFPYFFPNRPAVQQPGFNWVKALNPILVATLAAVLLKLTGGGGLVPRVFLSIMELVGNLAIPLILLIIGGTIYIDYRKRDKIRKREVVQFVLYKNILFPLVMLGVLLILRPSYDTAILLMLQSAAPPVTAVPLLTERCGGDRGAANQYLIASFVFSMGTIPLMITLFNMLYAG